MSNIRIDEINALGRVGGEVKARSQKARGLYVCNKAVALSEGLINPLRFVHLQSLADIDLKAKYFNYPVFARPCPTVPQHGFVDSRQVNNRDELISLFVEAIVADADAEVVLMDKVDADFNVILNASGTLTIGPGHDGATSGNKAITVNCSSVMPYDLRHKRYMATDKEAKDLLKSAGISDCAYLELVRTQDNIWFLTQLRDGPRLQGKTKDFIPSKTTVKRVFKADNYPNLLEWQALCKTLTDGDVVSHVGGARSSHYGIHCQLHNIPYITTFEPQVGQVLEPVIETNEIDYGKVKEGFLVGLTLPIDNQRQEAVLLMLAALHNYPYFGREESRLIGVAVALMTRLGLAASHGEHRHKGRGRRRRRPVLSRDQVYERCLVDLNFTLSRANRVRLSFYRDTCWSGSYGGPKWAECTEQTILLWNRAVKFINTPTKANCVGMIEQLNICVNCAHNGGWWLDKYVPAVWFDNAAAAPTLPLLIGAALAYKALTSEPVNAPCKLKVIPLKGMTLKRQRKNRSTVKAKQKIKVSIFDGPTAKIIAMQAAKVDETTLHVQFKDHYTNELSSLFYKSVDIKISPKLVPYFDAAPAEGYSFSGSGKKYVKLFHNTFQFGFVSGDSSFKLADFQGAECFTTEQFSHLIGENDHE